MIIYQPYGSKRSVFSVGGGSVWIWMGGSQVVVAGPFRVVEGDTFSTGGVAGDTFSNGGAEGDVFSTGGVAGDTRS